MSNRSKALQAKANQNRGCLWLFGGVFVAAGGAVFWIFSMVPLIQIVQAQSWIETPCLIEISRVETFTGDDGDTYRPYIQYSYAFGDGDYEGNSYTFVGGSSSGYNRHQRAVDRYPEGSSAVCYVDPEAPELSVLTRGLVADYFLGFFGLIFVAAGLLVIFLGTRTRKNHAAKSRDAHVVREVFPEPTGDRVTLESQAKPTGRFVGSVIATLIWVVVVVALLVNVGDLSFVTYLVAIPFLLFGVMLIVATAYNFLAMLNPRVRLSVDRGAARIGTDVEVDWAMIGASRRIDRFRIWIEGSEEARYTRGTNTYTDKYTFVRINVVTTSSRSEIAKGHAVISIPEYTMHSFDGGNNKIVWEFKVEGEIRRWPDVSNTFEYTVLPMAVKENP